jgi:hypothetical protein
MRRTVLVLAGLLGLTGAVLTLLNARAEQVADPVLTASLDPGDGDQGLGGAAEDAVLPSDDPAGAAAPHKMQGWRHRGPADGASALGLVYASPDKQLTAADVQKIAEAFLLWHGNHAWKVTDVADAGDNVTFSITTGPNTVVAKFAMDRHSGKLVRTG